MTKRDFFIVLVKLFGLYCAIGSLFSVLPSNIFFALMDVDLISSIWILFAALSVLGLFILLTFKAGKVVSLLKLDKGFDEDRIELGNLNSNGVLNLAIIVIAGLLILNTIPTFLSHILFAFKSDIIGMDYDMSDKFNWAVSGINLAIGFLLLTNYNSVTKFLLRKNNDSPT